MPISTVAALDVNLPILPNKRKLVLSFQSGMNQGIDAVNRLIVDYGESNDFEKKTRILEQLNRQIRALSILKPDPTVALQFKILETFWNQTLFEVEVEQRRQKALATPLTLSEFILSLPPKEVEPLVNILMENDRQLLITKLERFYPLGHPRKEALDVFLEGHSIEILSSFNSKNIKITDLETDESELLKLECWGVYGNKVEMHLRNQPNLVGVFSPIFAEQPVSYFHSLRQKQVAGRLTVTEFFKGGDLASYSKRFDNNDDARAEAAALVYTQMADVLIKVKAAGCAFIDMKNSNWLIGAEGHLRISDGKSFVPHNQGGEITPDIVCMKTDYLCAPEQFIVPRPHNISTDKIHVYLLAKNLYCFLTRDRMALLYERGKLKEDASEFDFSLPIFHTPLGAAYKKLIEMTMKKEPSDRLLTVVEFKSEMESIQSEHLERKSIEAIFLQSQFKDAVSSLRAEEEGKNAKSDQFDQLSKGAR